MRVYVQQGVQSQPALSPLCATARATEHVERVLNHATGQLGGVAGIYNRFQFLNEIRDALDRWAEHVESLEANSTLNSVARGDMVE